MPHNGYLENRAEIKILYVVNFKVAFSFLKIIGLKM